MIVKINENVMEKIIKNTLVVGLLVSTLITSSVAREFEYAPAEDNEEFFHPTYPFKSPFLGSFDFTQHDLKDPDDFLEREFTGDFCIIGPEERSREWLKDKMIKVFIQSMTEESYCIITNVESAQQLKDMKNLWKESGFESIPLIPMKKIESFRKYGILSYPAIINLNSKTAFQRAE